MTKRIYGKAQGAEHRGHNVVCEICGECDSLARVQHADTRVGYDRGQNRVKIDCAYYFDVDKHILWGTPRETAIASVEYLYAQGITPDWHNKKACSRCFIKFSRAINSR